MKTLTEKQQLVLDYICDYIKKHTSSPTYQEIQEHFDWSSSNAAHDFVNRLEEKGHLSVRRGVARGIWAVRRFERAK